MLTLFKFLNSKPVAARYCLEILVGRHSTAAVGLRTIDQANVCQLDLQTSPLGSCDMRFLRSCAAARDSHKWTSLAVAAWGAVPVPRCWLQLRCRTTPMSSFPTRGQDPGILASPTASYCLGWQKVAQPARQIAHHRRCRCF